MDFLILAIIGLSSLVNLVVAVLILNRIGDIEVPKPVDYRSEQINEIAQNIIDRLDRIETCAGEITCVIEKACIDWKASSSDWKKHERSKA